MASIPPTGSCSTTPLTSRSSTGRCAGKNYREEHRKWYLGDSISAGIGQGYNAFTPVQQAQAIAIIANDGVAFRPHLVKSIENVRAGGVRQIAPEPTHTIAIKPEH